MVKEKVLSFRADDNTNKIIEDVMANNNLKKSEAIRYLAQYYENSDGNSNPHIRKLLGEFVTDIETLLSNLDIQPEQKRNLFEYMEEFKCRIL